MHFSINTIDLLLGFSKALDLVKPQLAGHHLTVGYLTDSMAEVLGIPVPQRRALLLAAMFHDAGAIPMHTPVHDLIFENNPQQHSRAGWAILQTFPFLKDEAELVLYHHTPWDELRQLPPNPDIDIDPLFANIINVADRIDVMLRTEKLTPHAALTRIAALKDPIHQYHYNPLYIDAICEVLSHPILNNIILDDFPLAGCLRERYRDAVLTSTEVMNFSALFSLITDSISPFTATHSAGVGRTSSALLRTVFGKDTTQDDLEVITVAGLLHDIGKLSVNPILLEKPAALSQAEYHHMQSHARISHDLLSNIPGFERVRTWGCLHHERLDGSGYPFGLKANLIPLPSRIVAVADVFTAITEDRPYRAGLPMKEALFLIRDLSAKDQLDGDVVHQLCLHADEINAARSQAQADSTHFFTNLRNLFD